VAAITALHRYGGIPRHVGLKHYWIIAVIGAALIVMLVTWTIRRRQTDAIPPAAERLRGPG
jgi:membrane-associated protein